MTIIKICVLSSGLPEISQFPVNRVNAIANQVFIGFGKMAAAEKSAMGREGRGVRRF